jgi:dienelactone hydrolase
MLRAAVALRRLPAGLAVAIALGCHRPAPAPAPPSAPPPIGVSAREATLENGFLTVEAQVPAEPPGPKPAVIAFAGEQPALLQAGAIVVTYRMNWDVLKPLAPPSAPAPRNTVGAWLLAAPTPRTVGRGWFGVIAASAGRVPRVLDWLVGLPDVDPQRIGMMGTSTSGFIALEAAAADPRLAAVAAIAACGDYLDFLHHSTLAMGGAPLDLDPVYEESLRRRQAVAHPERLTHTALLMVNGTDDLAVPLSCATETARVLATVYAAHGAAQRFRFVGIANAGHNDLQVRARQEVATWFGRWLGLGLGSGMAPSVGAPAREEAGGDAAAR